MIDSNLDESSGIHLISNFEELDRKTISRLLKRERSAGKPCFVFFPHEWAKKSRQIQSHVSSYSNDSLRVFFARKCQVKKLEIKEVRRFCDEYHIQGGNKLGIAGWGIYSDKELLGVLSLGRHHRQDGDTLLDRLCFRDDVRVVGGASKLLSAAQKWAMESGISQIVSFSDNRYSPGVVYEKLGFNLDKELPPDYFYIESGDPFKYFSKQSQKKSSCNCPDDMTEHQWATARGLLRVYDGGKKRWVLPLRLERKSIKNLKSRRHGFYQTKKAGIIYFQSSYELRTAYLLDEMPEVESCTNQVRFILDSKVRYIDFLVKWTDGTHTVIEVKPVRQQAKCLAQISANTRYAAKQGWKFVIWREAELGFSSEHQIMVWADQFMSTFKDVDFTAERKRRCSERSMTYYQKHIAEDKVEVWCDYCKENHIALRLTYEKNIERNGNYICEKHGGFLAGSKPKKKKENPYAAEGKEQCAGECAGVKPFEEFGVDKGRPDGYARECKICRARKAQKRYEAKK